MVSIVWNYEQIVLGGVSRRRNVYSTGNCLDSFSFGDDARGAPVLCRLGVCVACCRACVLPLCSCFTPRSLCGWCVRFCVFARGAGVSGAAVPCLGASLAAVCLLCAWVRAVCLGVRGFDARQVAVGPCLRLRPEGGAWPSASRGRVQRCSSAGAWVVLLWGCRWHRGQPCVSAGRVGGGCLWAYFAVTRPAVVGRGGGWRPR